MQTYEVTQTIQSRDIDNNEPVNVSYYTGSSLAKAMSAMGSAAAGCQDEDKFYTILSVAMTVIVEEPASIVHKMLANNKCSCGNPLCPIGV